jgi:hypothetical protein
MKVLSLILLALPVLGQEIPTLPLPTEFASSMVPVTQSPSKAAWMEVRDQTPTPGRTLYRWSVATLVAANTADVLSSWSNREANPLVRSGAQFGVTSVAIKSGFVGVSLLLQHVAVRHRPDTYKRLAWMNFISSGVLGTVAAHNAELR